MAGPVYAGPFFDPPAHSHSLTVGPAPLVGTTDQTLSFVARYRLPVYALFVSEDFQGFLFSLPLFSRPVSFRLPPRRERCLFLFLLEGQPYSASWPDSASFTARLKVEAGSQGADFRVSARPDRLGP